MSLSHIKILHIDSNHPLLWEQLQQAGFHNEADFFSSKQERIDHFFATCMSRQKIGWKLQQQQLWQQKLRQQNTEDTGAATTTTATAEQLQQR